jgi:hypothetical protein
MKDNGYIVLDGFKGVWTLDEVVKMLQSNGLKVKIKMSTKEDDRLISRDDSSNLVEKEVR